MKMLVVICGLLLSAAPVLANECVVPVLVNNADWENSSTKQVSCMMKTSNGYKGLAVLCSEDKTDLSEKYKTFLSYQRAWQDALKEQNFKKVGKIENEWKLAGYEGEIESALYEVSIGLKRCR